MSTSKRYDIRRVTEIKNGSVIFEVCEIFDIEGDERAHRNADLAFETEAEAQTWIEKEKG